MKYSYKTKTNKTIRGDLIIFEAEDINDPTWDEIFNVLRQNGYEIRFADGNYVNIIADEVEDPE